MKNLTKRQHGELAYLIFSGGVVVEVSSSYGGESEQSDCEYFLQYAVFIPKLQEKICGNLDEYDGIHYLDEHFYCGSGESLREAYEEFIANNPNIFDYMNSESKLSEKYIDIMYQDYKDYKEL